MPFPWFKNGKLLFCNGTLAASCCGSQILTISLALVGNVGVYNAAAFSFAGEVWGNACGNPGGGWVNGIDKGPWISSFDMSILATDESPEISVIIRADCNQWHEGDTVGVIRITATYQGVTVTADLTPSPINPYADDWTPRCPPGSAASLTVRCTLNEGVTIS